MRGAGSRAGTRVRRVLEQLAVKCLDLARGEPDLAAGRIAAATGLSASAVTSVLDRLERAGFIERVRDPADRRKVRVRSTGRHEAALGLTGSIADRRT